MCHHARAPAVGCLRNLAATRDHALAWWAEGQGLGFDQQQLSPQQRLRPAENTRVLLVLGESGPAEELLAGLLLYQVGPLQTHKVRAPQKRWRSVCIGEC